MSQSQTNRHRHEHEQHVRLDSPLETPLSLHYICQIIASPFLAHFGACVGQARNVVQ